MNSSKTSKTPAGVWLVEIFVGEGSAQHWELANEVWSRKSDATCSAKTWWEDDKRPARVARYERKERGE